MLVIANSWNSDYWILLHLLQAFAFLAALILLVSNIFALIKGDDDEFDDKGFEGQTTVAILVLMALLLILQVGLLQSLKYV